VAFYTVFAVGHHSVSKVEIGWMTGLLMGIKILANPLMGWMADCWSHRGVMELGLAAATLSALLAWLAPGANWFYLVFALTGISEVALWTLGLSMTLEFGEESERPAYIGLANTLIAPANILAPFLGGWLADMAGYPAAFLASAVGGLAAAAVFHLLVRDPVQATQSEFKTAPEVK
jgi:MFS family permease